jgi:hypothetical protein
VEPSEEIRRIVERWILAISGRDIDAALGRLSENPGAAEGLDGSHRLFAVGLT